jgi:phage terminase small subunit
MEHLSGKSKEIYEFYRGKAARTPGQVALLVRALEALDEAEKCREILETEGLTIVSERSGVTRQNPLIGVRNEATATALKIFKLLGLELHTYPSSDGFNESYTTEDRKC